jgi:hypothetical protein
VDERGRLARPSAPAGVIPAVLQHERVQFSARPTWSSGRNPTPGFLVPDCWRYASEKTEEVIRDSAMAPDGSVSHFRSLILHHAGVVSPGSSERARRRRVSDVGDRHGLAHGPFGSSGQPRLAVYPLSRLGQNEWPGRHGLLSWNPLKWKGLGAVNFAFPYLPPRSASCHSPGGFWRPVVRRDRKSRNGNRCANSAGIQRDSWGCLHIPSWNGERATVRSAGRCWNGRRPTEGLESHHRFPCGATVPSNGTFNRLKSLGVCLAGVPARGHHTLYTDETR